MAPRVEGKGQRLWRTFFRSTDGVHDAAASTIVAEDETLAITDFETKYTYSEQ